MATASHIELSPARAGVYHVPNITTDSAKIGSELLQKNHDDYHMYFNRDGFHNHIAHHLLTLFALGATTQQLQHAFDHNKGHQRAQYPVDTRVVQSMADREKFKEFLGNEKYFHDYEVYFTKEIDEKGWQAVLNEHLFAGDDHAERLLTRMFAGFYHPIIHLGFGIEFEQPAIIVEALAQAAIPDGWVADFLHDAEKLANDNSESASNPPKSIVQLLSECRANPTIKSSPDLSDPNKIRDGIFQRARSEMTTLASQFRIPSPSSLPKLTASMISTAAFFAGAAQHPPHQVKIDFFYMHCVNCSIFFSAFLDQKSNNNWLSPANKTRLLEWKARMDIVLYVSRGSPELLPHEITTYKPRHVGGWDSIIARVKAYEDDGHAAKLIRALAHGETVCRPYTSETEYADTEDYFPVRGDMWLQLGHMAIDSVEGDHPEGAWVRNVGFEEAWEGVPVREGEGEGGSKL